MRTVNNQRNRTLLLLGRLECLVEYAELNQQDETALFADLEEVYERYVIRQGHGYKPEREV